MNSGALILMKKSSMELDRTCGLEHGDDLWVGWSLEEDTSYADYLEREAFRTWMEEVEEMQYLTSCEPSGDAVEVISLMMFSWGGGL